MSCEIRSMITRYPLGSAISTPPSFTNSAVTPSTFMLLIFSTTAGGKVFSMPNKIPIFFIRNSPLNKHTAILSEVTFSQSEAVTKSKDPCASSSSDIAPRRSPHPGPVVAPTKDLANGQPSPAKNISPPFSPTTANRVSNYPPKHPANEELPSDAAWPTFSHSDPDTYPSLPMPEQSASAGNGSETNRHSCSARNPPDN